MKLWKRNLIAAAIVLFVCGAVYLNWSYTQDTAAGRNLGQAALVGRAGGPAADPARPRRRRRQIRRQVGRESRGRPRPGRHQANDPATAESGSYFSTARLNRQQARDNALSLLQEAAKDEKADQTAVDEANASIPDHGPTPPSPRPRSRTSSPPRATPTAWPFWGRTASASSSPPWTTA